MYIADANCVPYSGYFTALQEIKKNCIFRKKIRLKYRKQHVNRYWLTTNLHKKKILHSKTQESRRLFERWAVNGEYTRNNRQI